MFKFINKKSVPTFLVLWASFTFYKLFMRPLNLPTFNTTKYWGPDDGSNYVEDTNILELNIKFEKDIINHLHRTLEKPLLFTDPLEDSAFNYGFNTYKVRPLIDYWRAIYLTKWKVREEYINKYKHFLTHINGLAIHFVRMFPTDYKPSVGHYRIPILLLHGWPGSFLEFYQLIPKLLKYTNEDEFGFEVVVPSLVGFGFSSPPGKKGFSASEMAIVMRNLMLRLNYKRFIVHGGDWGSIIGSHMATIFPENVMGFHTNFCVMQSPIAIIKTMVASLYPPLFVEKQYESFHFPISEKLKFILQEGGYFYLQATKPDTIGIALTANPAGLAVYILEKFSTGTNSSFRDLEDGGIFDMSINLDTLLDNIMIYYLGNNIISSMRFYADSVKNNFIMERVPTHVPMGCIRFKNDIPTPVDWALRGKYKNIIHLEYSEIGGHFAAMEVPDILYKDITSFVRKLCLVTDCKNY